MSQVTSTVNAKPGRFVRQRLLPAAGLAFALVLAAALVGLFAGGAEPNDPYGSIARTLAGERTGLLVRYSFQLLGAGLFLAFLGALSSVLYDAEGDKPTLSRVALTAGVVGITLVTITNAINAALAASIAGASGDGAVWAVFQLGQAIFTFAAMFLGIFLLAASEVIRETGVLPRWVSFLGLVAGVAYVVGSFSVADQRGPSAIPALVGFVLFIVWTSTVSVTMVVRRLG